MRFRIQYDPGALDADMVWFYPVEAPGCRDVRVAGLVGDNRGWEKLMDAMMDGFQRPQPDDNGAVEPLPVGTKVVIERVE